MDGLRVGKLTANFRFWVNYPFKDLQKWPGNHNGIDVIMSTLTYDWHIYTLALLEINGLLLKIKFSLDKFNKLKKDGKWS